MKQKKKLKEIKRISIKSKFTTAGVTLVALVVTIVVLLILAGITITYVFGDNSVFKQASDAKLKTDIAQWQERLETAKSPIFIEGLGTFDPDAYFQYIQEQGIINNKDIDVVDNGDGTYDVTTKSGYVFLVTLMPTPEKPTDAEIEYLGQTGKLMPKLKGIVVTNKTKTSIDIRILARLEGGSVKAYWKKASEIVGEEENNIEGYTEFSLDSNLAGQISGLTAGEEYKIKAILEKDEETVSGKSINVVTGIAVSSITLNKTEETIDMGKELKLEATVKPDEAENKEVIWSSSALAIATVDQTGKVTGVAEGETTITVTSKDLTAVKAECKITVQLAESNWEEIAKIAKHIAIRTDIDSSSTVAKGTTEEGINYDIDIKNVAKNQFYVKYNGEIRQVRVIGFNHDELVDKDVYKVGKDIEKAGVTFEFVDFMTGTDYMPISDTNPSTTGWGETTMRAFLNGEGKENLSVALKNNIKQVKKEYCPVYNSMNTTFSEDFLWLLSLQEVATHYSSKYEWTGGCVGGSIYPYYAPMGNSLNGYSLDANKSARGGTRYIWWLRSQYPGTYGMGSNEKAGAFFTVPATGLHANTSQWFDSLVRSGSRLLCVIVLL